MSLGSWKPFIYFTRDVLYDQAVCMNLNQHLNVGKKWAVTGVETQPEYKQNSPGNEQLKQKTRKIAKTSQRQNSKQSGNWLNMSY